jgi:hypothetical protein
MKLVRCCQDLRRERERHGFADELADDHGRDGAQAVARDLPVSPETLRQGGELHGIGPAFGTAGTSTTNCLSVRT